MCKKPDCFLMILDIINIITIITIIAITIITIITITTITTPTPEQTPEQTPTVGSLHYTDGSGVVSSMPPAQK